MKTPVTTAWVVRASRTKVRKVNGQEVRGEEIKAVSNKYTVREAAEIFLRLFTKEHVPHTWERAWVSPVEGYEE